MLYKMQLKKRVTGDMNNSGVLMKIMEVQEWGMYVYARRKEDFCESFVRRHLVGMYDEQCIIEADSPEEAIAKFNALEGAMIGGEDRKAKALWINEDEPILELPPCQRRNISSRGQYICGEEMGGNGNGELGMCMLAGFDPSHDCPVEKFLASMHDKDKTLETVTIEGFKFVRILSILKS